MRDELTINNEYDLVSRADPGLGLLGASTVGYTSTPAPDRNTSPVAQSISSKAQIPLGLLGGSSHDGREASQISSFNDYVPVGMLGEDSVIGKDSGDKFEAPIPTGMLSADSYIGKINCDISYPLLGGSSGGIRRIDTDDTCLF
jgi:hypothetical protein